MSEMNPYQPPETDVEVSGDLDGYRDLQYFMVKPDFVAPRICYFTGKEVEEDAEPMKVLLPLHYKLPYYLYAVTIIATITMVEWSELADWVAYLAVVGFFISGRIYCAYSLKFFVHCEKKLLKVYKVKNVIGNLLSSIGLVLLLTHDEANGDSQMIIGLVLILGSAFLLKRPLKCTSKVGEYGQCEGAHPKFLDALPFRDKDFEELFLNE